MRSDTFNRTRNTVPATDTINAAGAAAYAYDDKHALAQLALTGVFHNKPSKGTSEEALASLRELVSKVDPVFVLRLAVYARRHGRMKDMPAALLAAVSKISDPGLWSAAFDTVIDTGLMLRTFVQMIRSGVFDRNSITGRVRAAIKRWFTRVSDELIVSGTIGEGMTLRDVLRLARPCIKNEKRSSLLRWVVGKQLRGNRLPAFLQDYTGFMQIGVMAGDVVSSKSSVSPGARGAALQSLQRDQEVLAQKIASSECHVRWDMLAPHIKSEKVWRILLPMMGYQAIRMNLNTLARHGVFDGAEGREAANYVAARLTDVTDCRAQLPYQLYAAYKHAEDGVPSVVRQALSTAADRTRKHLPNVGRLLVAVDVSGSMGDAVTGDRGSNTSAMRVVDVAAVFAAGLLKRNPDSHLCVFNSEPEQMFIDPGGTILSIATRLSAKLRGGTDCGCVIRWADAADHEYDAVVLVSDNESWARQPANGTGLMAAWGSYSRKHPGTKLICLDISPGRTTQAASSP